MTASPQKRILLVIGGGIAAYKALELVRRLRERGFFVRAVMTDAAQKFVTKLSVESLTGNRGLRRSFRPDGRVPAWAISNCPAMRTSLLSRPPRRIFSPRWRMGLAGDLASTLLLATDKKILAAPAMNLRMWLHPATQRNCSLFTRGRRDFRRPRGRRYGLRRIWTWADERARRHSGRDRDNALRRDAPFPCQRTAPARKHATGTLAGRRVLVTSGPTHEPIDPVRYIGNRSSGKQGHAIAAAAAAAGAEVVLISGPVALADPLGVTTIHVETARDMLRQVEAALPADIFIGVAAVADWRVAETSPAKIKKDPKTDTVLCRLSKIRIFWRGRAAGRRTARHLSWASRPKAKNCTNTRKPS